MHYPGEAILLCREVPSRSIPQSIEILEMEGRVAAGFLKRTTLQDKLQERGYSARQMKLYQEGGVAARRFQRQERGDLWHSDIKFGPFLSINGVKKQIYLVSFLDDATRYVVHGEFYDSLDQTVVEDCLRKAILKEGLPKRVYFDNGKQYRNKWMERACAVLGIRLLFAKPYSPEATGKIERFNRTVDSFLDEVALKQCRVLDDYNRYFRIWLAECYHTRVHASLKGQTPEVTYKSANAPLRFVPPETVVSAFLRVDTRKVDKSGCISFGNKRYEVGVLLVGQTVTVAYNPNDTETLTVEHGAISLQVKELQAGAHAGPRPKLPTSMLPALLDTSRLLDQKIFSEAAIDDIFQFSSGISRLINKACTSSLIYGAQNRKTIIDDRMAKLVIECELSEGSTAYEQKCHDSAVSFRANRANSRTAGAVGCFRIGAPAPL